MPENLENSPNARESGKFLKFPKFLLESNGGVFKIFQNFPKCFGIWEIPKMQENLGNFPNNWVSGKFSKCLGIWEFLKCLGIWEFLKCLGVWEIPQIP